MVTVGRLDVEMITKEPAGGGGGGGFGFGRGGGDC